MKRIASLFIVIVFFLASCGGPEKPKPEVFLSEAQMVDVMTDVQIMESIIGYKKNVNQKTAYIKARGYDTLFAHHGITDSIFEENLLYYNEVEPLVLERVLDSVIARLGKMKD